VIDGTTVVAAFRADALFLWGPMCDERFDDLEKTICCTWRRKLLFRRSCRDGTCPMASTRCIDRARHTSWCKLSLLSTSSRDMSCCRARRLIAPVSTTPYRGLISSKDKISPRSLLSFWTWIYMTAGGAWSSSSFLVRFGFWAMM
jgi:hypothetical protein